MSDGYCLWSQRFDCKMTDIFDVQDEMAKTIANLLKVELGSKARSGLVKRYTQDLEAYDLYLRGRFQWNKRSGEGFQKALEYFERALTLDPDYAPAHTGIADYYISVASWGLVHLRWRRGQTKRSCEPRRSRPTRRCPRHMLRWA